MKKSKSFVNVLRRQFEDKDFIFDAHAFTTFINYQDQSEDGINHVMRFTNSTKMSIDSMQMCTQGTKHS